MSPTGLPVRRALTALAAGALLLGSVIGGTASVSAVQGRTVPVKTSAELSAALSSAEPGDVIILAAGVYTSPGVKAPVRVGGKQYSGTFVAARSGTAGEPITLQGSSRAVINGNPGGDGTAGRYGLYLVGADHWTIKGITVANASKGIVLDETDHTRIIGVTVRRTGEEGIHLRANSSHDLVRAAHVARTGRRVPGFGEGIYIGTAVSNWGTYTGGRPDASDHNRILDNVVSNTGAESIDVKEGTSGGTISGNSFDGAGMAGSHYADSWIDLKGNGWTVTRNTGVNALKDGFQVHRTLSGWGNGNVFRNNTARVNAPGAGFWIQSGTRGNAVACSNVVSGARSGLANVPCRKKRPLAWAGARLRPAATPARG